MNKLWWKKNTTPSGVLSDWLGASSCTSSAPHGGGHTGCGDILFPPPVSSSVAPLHHSLPSLCLLCCPSLALGGSRLGGWIPPSPPSRPLCCRPQTDRLAWRWGAGTTPGWSPFWHMVFEWAGTHGMDCCQWRPLIWRRCHEIQGCCWASWLSWWHAEKERYIFYNYDTLLHTKAV